MPVLLKSQYFISLSTTILAYLSSFCSFIFCIKMFNEKLKELRVIDGFKFRFHRIMKNDIQRWACTKKRCNAFNK